MVNADLKKSNLKSADINKIGTHAKDMNMTVKNYLEYSGFDVSEMKDGGYLVSGGSSDRTRKVWTFGANGINVSQSGAKEEYLGLISNETYRNHKNRGKNFFYFEAE